jgi:PAS domain-containing protein
VRAGLGIVAPGVVLAVLVGLLQSWLSLDTGGVMVLVATAGVAVGFQAWWSRRRRGARARLALEDAALRLADGDAATRIAWPPGDELAPVMAAANELADRWDQTRRLQHERELVLGAVLDVAPMATLVVDRHDRVVYANRAAAGLFGLPGALAGRGLAEVAAGLDPPLDQALLDGAAEGIFVLDNRDADVVFLRRRRLTLQSTAATVILVERLTREVRRSEVAMWKKTTRVLSHELNNSLLSSPVMPSWRGSRLRSFRSSPGPSGWRSWPSWPGSGWQELSPLVPDASIRLSSSRSSSTWSRTPARRALRATRSRFRSPTSVPRAFCSSFATPGPVSAKLPWLRRTCRSGPPRPAEVA